MTNATTPAADHRWAAADSLYRTLPAGAPEVVALAAQLEAHEDTARWLVMAYGVRAATGCTTLEAAETVRAYHEAILDTPAVRDAVAARVWELLRG